MRGDYLQKIKMSYDATGKYTALYNQIGLAFQVSLKKEINFFVGLHHFLNYARGQQFLDFRENGISDEILGILPQNKGIGLELKYPFANNIDFILDADYYYEAHPRLGTGFNRESFRLSAIYNFRWNANLRRQKKRIWFKTKFAFLFSVSSIIPSCRF